MWETIWSVSEASTLQNSMNFGIRCMISRTVILSNIFPGQLLLATWKRLLLKRKDTILWVSERQSNHRNDSLWFSESLKAYLPHGWLATGQVKRMGFYKYSTELSREQRSSSRNPKTLWPTENQRLGQTSGLLQKQLSWGASWHLMFSCVGSRGHGPGSSWRASLATNHRPRRGKADMFLMWDLWEPVSTWSK